ncbi:YceI family protein [Acinetobacter sp. c1-l78]|uniref:YceI family protein n=1 Tax=Acinetobacter sp. c1-l78 TaxID=3342803 RepID=UPI0035B96E74
MKQTILSLFILGLVACTPQHNTETASSVETAASSQVTPTDAADWVLEKANITFTSTKADTQSNQIKEDGLFTAYSGHLDKQGNFNMQIDLSSADTDIAIRDQRIKEWLFETDKFAQARIQATLDPEVINKLDINQKITLEQPLSLNIRGKQVKLNSTLDVTRTSTHTISVVTTKPVELDITKFGMSDGLVRLKEVMGLSDISYIVPVNFQGDFKRP